MHAFLSSSPEEGALVRGVPEDRAAPGSIEQAVGREMLTEVVEEYLDSLGTSVLVLEANGSTAFSLVRSPWCRLLASRGREPAMEGRLHAPLVQEGHEVDAESGTGLRLFLVPVRAREVVVGALGFFHGTPPQQEEEWRVWAASLGLPLEVVREAALASPRTREVDVEAARRRLRASARMVGEMVARHWLEQELSERNRDLETKNQELAAKNRELEALRCEAEEARSAEARMMMIMKFFEDSAPVGFAYLDQNLRYVKVNEKLAEFHGKPLDWFLGRSVEEALSPDFSDVVEIYRAVLAGGEPVMREFSGAVPGEPGVIRTWWCSYYPVRTPDGEVVGVGAIIDEVTERKRYENRLREQAVELEMQMLHGRGLNAELRRQLTEIQRLADELEGSNRELVRMTAAAEIARQEAERANQSKASFLAAMSHDLRTPLNAIAGYVELLEMGIQGPVTEKQLHAFGRIRQNQRHLLGLLQDILSFAKLEAGHLEMQVEEVRVSELMETLEALTAPQLRAKRLRFSTCLQGGGDVQLRGDRDKVQQILLNLVGNAIKFTAEEGEIEVLAEAEATGLRFQVRDTGCGIPRERWEEIFSPFVQGHDSIRPEGTEQGIGLGLAISRELARAMGGDLTVESEVGRGSTFLLTLPRALPEAGKAAGSAEHVFSLPITVVRPPLESGAESLAALTPEG